MNDQPAGLCLHATISTTSNPTREVPLIDFLSLQDCYPTLCIGPVIPARRVLESIEIISIRE